MKDVRTLSITDSPPPPAPPRPTVSCPARNADARYDWLRRFCPTCGELSLRIVYGYPTGPLTAAARRGKVLLGGCTYGTATHRCPAGHAFEAVDPA